MSYLRNNTTPLVNVVPLPGSHTHSSTAKLQLNNKLYLIMNLNFLAGTISCINAKAHYSHPHFLSVSYSAKTGVFDLLIY
jgi:hypothetical protein